MIFILTIREQDHPVPGALYLDCRPGKQELRRDSLAVFLPFRQYKLVQCLMADNGVDVDQWKIFYHVWGEGSDGGPLAAQECVHQLCANVRKKIAFMGLTVKSVRKGYGYRIMEIEAGNEVS